MGQISCHVMQDVVAFAIDREEKARDFYAQCAQKAQKPGIKEFFQDMAKEEERHKQLLTELDTDLLERLDSLPPEDLKLSDFLVDVQFTPDITYQEALAMAMKKEEKAHAFYQAWEKKCTNEKTSKVFSMLADEELKHKRKIEEIYDSEILTWD
jgi:rubrerythrin